MEPWLIVVLALTGLGIVALFAGGYIKGGADIGAGKFDLEARGRRRGRSGGNASIDGATANTGDVLAEGSGDATIKDAKAQKDVIARAGQKSRPKG